MVTYFFAALRYARARNSALVLSVRLFVLQQSVSPRAAAKPAACQVLATPTTRRRAALLPFTVLIVGVPLLHRLRPGKSDGKEESLRCIFSFAKVYVLQQR